jgi:hypothetical protein
MKWFTKKKEEKQGKELWNYIVKPEDSSGYYWRHVREDMWRLWSPKHEYVGVAHNEAGILSFYLGGWKRAGPDWKLDVDRGTWKVKIIVKVLDKVAEDERTEALLAKIPTYNPIGEDE